MIFVLVVGFWFLLLLSAPCWLRLKGPRSVGAQYATGDQWRNNPRKNEGVGVGNGNPLQYSCLVYKGAWQATFHGGHKELDMTEHTFSLSPYPSSKDLPSPPQKQNDYNSIPSLTVLSALRSQGL